MERLTSGEISKIVRGEIISGSSDIYATDVAIDSREAGKHSVFVALSGEQTDGHRFLKNAYENGSVIFLISDKDLAYEYGKDVLDSSEAAIIMVDDTLMALQELSGEYLRRMNMRSIAVTGSVGKTTTRDMLYSAVSTKFASGTNKKNYNSETGLPLTLLNFTKDMEVGVLEMGMDAPGQIARLVEIAEPDAAIITNIGISHIERLGSRENILKAKMEVTSEFDSESTLIINADDDMLIKEVDRPLPFNIIKVGTKTGTRDGEAESDQTGAGDLDYEVSGIEDLGIDGISFTIKKRDNKEKDNKAHDNKSQGKKIIEEKVKLNVPGAHNALNCALAIAGAEVMGVGMKDAISGIKNMKMTGSRLRIVDTGKVRIIDDAYNAAPQSMKSALSTLSNTRGKRRVAVLGGINELGDISEKEHRGIGEFARECDIDLLITIGEMAAWIGDEAEKSGNIQYMHFDTKEQIYPIIQEIFKEGDIILIKASRSYELDKLGEEIAKAKL